MDVVGIQTEKSKKFENVPGATAIVRNWFSFSTPLAKRIE